MLVVLGTDFILDKTKGHIVNTTMGVVVGLIVHLIPFVGPQFVTALIIAIMVFLALENSLNTKYNDILSQLPLQRHEKNIILFYRYQKRTLLEFVSGAMMR